MHHFSIKLCAVLAAMLMLTAMLAGCAQAPDTDPSDTSYSESTEQKYTEREDIETMLFVCLKPFEIPEDTISYRNAFEADFLMLLVIDARDRTTRALQLNPDTLVSFTELGSTESVMLPLGQVFTYGSGGSDSFLSGKKAVSKLLGNVTIDHYLSFTADSIAVLTDMLGGLTVASDDAREQSTTLSGEDTVAFFTDRAQTDLSNEVHMRRQRQYMTVMFPAFIQNARQEDFLTQLMLRLGEGMATDLTVSQMVQMLELLDTYTIDDDILTVSGKGEQVDGQFRFYMDEDELEQTVRDLLLELSAA